MHLFVAECRRLSSDLKSVTRFRKHVFSEPKQKISEGDSIDRILFLKAYFYSHRVIRPRVLTYFLITVT